MVEDLTYLKWNSIKSTTQGIIYKSYKNGIYYKLPLLEYRSYGIEFNDRLNISEIVSSKVGNLLEFSSVKNILIDAKIIFKNEIIRCKVLSSEEYDKNGKKRFCHLKNIVV